ncbi:MAG: methyltransferase domain-containing protein, partial [Planctomycetota bacterium]
MRFRRKNTPLVPPIQNVREIEETDLMKIAAMRLSSMLTAVCLCLGLSAIAHAAEGEDILSQADFHGGLIVHLDCGDGSLTAQLCRSENTVVLGLERDPAKVAQARTRLHAEGLYGRVAVVQYDGNRIPLLDDSVTLIVAENTTVPRDEILRVLHPFGKAWIDGEVTVKPLPPDIDQWTHYLHEADNNAVAHDKRIGPPRHMQFLADPLWTRHHDRLSSFTTAVTAEGRLFYISDYGPVFDPDEPPHWFVTARDAFNGAFLWRRPISSWTDFMRKFRSGPVQLQRLLATDGKRVFVTLGLDEPVSVLDAADGEVLAVYDSTRHAEEFVLDDGILYVQVGARGAEHALIEQGKKASQLDYRQKRLVAVDTRSGKTLWMWPAEDAADIMPRTLAVAAGNVFVQEGNTTLCLDARTGTPRWRTPLPGKAQNAKKGKGSTFARSMGWTYATLVVHDDVVLSCDGKTLQALDSTSGKALWQCEARTPFGRTPSVDILVVRDVVWTSPDLDTGRDLHTGKIVRQTNLTETLVTAGHHHRCYRNKATDRFVIQGYRGLEFRDTIGEEHVRHNWLRGICEYGILRANGMVYLPPHNCGCDPEAKLYGLWALKSTESSFDPDSLSFGRLIETGPAFD